MLLECIILVRKNKFGFVGMKMNRYKLGDICEIVSGSTPKTSVDEFWDGDIKWITPAELNDDSYIITDSVRKITELAVKKTGLTSFPEGTVILSSRAPIGKVAIAGCEMYCHQGFKNVICSEKINSRYLYWFLKGNTDFLNSLGRGATFKEISKQIVANIEINVPDYAKQLEVVEHLEKVSEIIKLRKQELLKLNELIKARFVELFGNPITNTKNLETKDLRDTLILKAGDFTAASDIAEEPDDTNIYPCYGGNGIRGYVSEYNQDGEYSLVGRQGALSGNVQYARGKFRNTEHALLVTPMVEMNSIWLNQLLLNLDLKRYQTGAAQPGLSVKNLQEIPILMVPIADQNEFADFVKQVDKSKVVVQKALDEAQLLFDSLMQKYFG